MLKINDLVIKLFFALYLVSINYCNIFLFVCEYVYHEYAFKWLCMRIFVFYLLSGIDNDCVILFISYTKV